MELSHGCKTIGGKEQVSTPPCQDFNNLPSSTLTWNTPTHLKRHPSCQMKSGSIPSLPQTRGNNKLTTVPDQMRPRHEGMPKQKASIASKEYMSPNSPDCDRQLLKFLFLWCFYSSPSLWCFYLLSSLHVCRIYFVLCMWCMEVNTDGWLML